MRVMICDGAFLPPLHGPSVVMVLAIRDILSRWIAHEHVPSLRLCYA